MLLPFSQTVRPQTVDVASETFLRPFDGFSNRQFLPCRSHAHVFPGQRAVVAPRVALPSTVGRVGQRALYFSGLGVPSSVWVAGFGSKTKKPMVGVWELSGPAMKKSKVHNRERVTSSERLGTALIAPIPHLQHSRERTFLERLEGTCQGPVYKLFSALYLALS
jgi:hypothetical protein